MKHLLKVCFLIIFSFIFISCEQVIDNYWENKERENYTSPYIGIWIGTYAGNEIGIIKIEVLKSGTCNVTLSDFNYNIKEIFYGNVNDYGAFNSVFSQKTGFKLFGNLVLKDNSGSGTWTMGNFSGTWQAKK